MVVDTSAIVAILLEEPGAIRFGQALQLAATRLMSAVTRVELSLVLEGRKREAGRIAIERLMAPIQFEIVAVTAEHAELAIEAFRRFGKGRHPAGLNFGDCFSYALARASGQPLLFAGRDFGRTDVQPAMLGGQ